ncbi:MAG TPA: hypothetical protein PK816_09825 [Candidatus Cloacimonadota bacterium]|nr:hypothetical protein [Candidatus Cloacimonadota bacterium]
MLTLITIWLMLLLSLIALGATGTYDGSTKNSDIEIEDWGNGKLAGLDKENTVLRSRIELVGLGNKPTDSRNFNWLQDSKSSIKITPTGASSGTLTVSSVSGILKDDVFYNTETDKTFIVTELPVPGTTSIKVKEIGSSGTYIEDPSTDWTGLNKQFLKVYTSKAEGSNDHVGLNYNPENFKNCVSIFEDVATTADVTAHESWQLSEYSHREYQKVKQLIKHKEDMNRAIYIGKHFFDPENPTRMFSKGITNFNNVQVLTGDAFSADGKTLLFTIKDFDSFIATHAKKYSKAKEIDTYINNNFIVWLNELIRSCSTLSFDPFGAKDAFGFKVKKLIHSMLEMNLIIDETLNELYPNHVIALNQEMKKIGLRHFSGFDTKITLDVQGKGSHQYEDQIYTIGNGVQLYQPECTSMLKLNFRASS